MACTCHPHLLRMSQQRNREGLLRCTLQWWLIRNNSFSALFLAFQVGINTIPIAFFIFSQWQDNSSLCTNIPSIKLWSISHSPCIVFSAEHLGFLSKFQVVLLFFQLSRHHSLFSIAWYQWASLGIGNRPFWIGCLQKLWRNMSEIQVYDIVRGMQTSSGFYTAKSFFSLCQTMW